MPNTNCAVPIQSSNSPRSRDGHGVEPSSRRSAALLRSPSGTTVNPFASFAPRPGAVGREANAETKLYEVPRELIEIARARANGPSPTEHLTPLVPRPGPELEAAVRAYTAPVSNAEVLTPLHIPLEVVSGERETMPPGGREPLAGRSSRPSQVARKKVVLSAAPDFRTGTLRRAWLLYAGLSLTIAYCAHMLSSL